MCKKMLSLIWILYAFHTSTQEKNEHEKSYMFNSTCICCTNTCNVLAYLNMLALVSGYLLMMVILVMFGNYFFKKNSRFENML
jgi:hypothetical protein